MRWRRLQLLLGVVLGASASAQAEPTPVAAPFEAAVKIWLESDGTVPVLRERAGAALRQDEAVGLPWLGQRLSAIDSLGAQQQDRLRDLATEVMLRCLADGRDSGMTFRGQYAALTALGPFAPARALELLLKPPAWFAETRRVELVPLIADLQVLPPPPPVLLGITDVIAATETEPDDLRLALSCLVWQWGRKEPVLARAATLREASADGDAEDRLVAMRQLADLWYRVQDHVKAAGTHAAMTSMATRGKLQLSPTDWYWGACYCALGGRVDDGIAALERCADLLASPSTDSSQRLPRRLFERDPDLGKLRADPRFAAIVERAFAPAREPDKGR